MTAWIVTSSVLILAVIVLRAVLKGRIGLRLQYSLWLLVLLRLLIPGSLFETDVSILNTLEMLKQPFPEAAALEQIDIPTRSYTDAYRQVAHAYEAQGIDTALIDPEILTDQVVQAQETISLPQLLRQIWIAGMALVGIWLLTVNLTFGHRLRSSRKPTDCAGSQLPVYYSSQVSTPCLFGLFRPAIYLTVEATADALPHVLAHELTHYRHGDHIWSFLRSICLVLHWYNPLVWWAAALSRRDAELACDEGAVRRLGESQRIAYGQTLIRLTCGSKRNPILVATTMTENKKSLKERITLLAKHPKTALCTLIAVLCITVLIAGCTFTGAKQADSPAALTADRVEIRLFGSDVVQDDLTDAQIRQLTDLYENKIVTQTTRPVGDAARLTVTFYHGSETAAVWTVTPDVCAAADIGNFIWENSGFDTIWTLYWQSAPVDGGSVANLLMSSLPPRLTAEEAQAVLEAFRSMELTATSNELDFAHSLYVQLTSSGTNVLSFQIDQKGEVVIFNQNPSVQEEDHAHYYMCKNGPTIYKALVAIYQRDQSGTALSQETLDELTVWLSQADNYGFLLSEYEDIRDVSLHQVFYSGAGLQEYGNEDYVQQAMAPAYTDITCLHKDDMDELLRQRTGYGLTEMHDPLEYWRYLDEYGLYAHEHGDTNLNRYICTGGYRAVTGTELYVVNYQIVHMWFNRTANGSTYLTQSGTVVLQKVSDGYRFISNTLHPASE